MLIKRVGIGNIDEAFIEDRFGEGLNIIFSDDNNKGKTLVMQGIMYALGNEPIFPKGFVYKQYYFFCEIEVNGNIMKVLRKDRFFVVLYHDEMFKFDYVSEFKYFIKDKQIFDIPTISKKGISMLCGMELFYELFFVGQDKRNTSNIINRGQYNKEDFMQMLCSMNGYPLVEVDDTAINKRIKEIKGEMQTTKKLLSLLRDNPEISKYINKYGDTEAFKEFKEKVEKLNTDISSYKRKRQLETNRKYKLNVTHGDNSNKRYPDCMLLSGDNTFRLLSKSLILKEVNNLAAASLSHQMRTYNNTGAKTNSSVTPRFIFVKK